MFVAAGVRSEGYGPPSSPDFRGSRDHFGKLQSNFWKLKSRIHFLFKRVSCSRVSGVSIYQILMWFMRFFQVCAFINPRCFLSRL